MREKSHLLEQGAYKIEGNSSLFFKWNRQNTLTPVWEILKAYYHSTHEQVLFLVTNFFLSYLQQQTWTLNVIIQ